MIYRLSGVHGRSNAKVGRVLHFSSKCNLPNAANTIIRTHLLKNAILELESLAHTPKPYMKTSPRLENLPNIQHLFQPSSVLRSVDICGSRFGCWNIEWRGRLERYKLLLLPQEKKHYHERLKCHWDSYFMGGFFSSRWILHRLVSICSVDDFVTCTLPLLMPILLKPKRSTAVPSQYMPEEKLQPQAYFQYLHLCIIPQAYRFNKNRAKRCRDQVPNSSPS